MWLYVPKEPPQVQEGEARILSLCSGAAMLDEGVRAGLEALGLRAVTVGYCERETYAAACLVARMEDEALAQAPVWDDLQSFPCELYRGRVDCVTAGFPCQPWSVAGQRKGQEDDRWLWPLIARIIRGVGPRLVILENVPGLLVHDGLGSVLGDLAEMGFDAEWGVLSAGAVGAGHKRERVFIVAYAKGSYGSIQLRAGKQRSGAQPGGCREVVADAGREPSQLRRAGQGVPRAARKARREAWKQRGRDAAGDRGAPEPDADGARLRGGRFRQGSDADPLQDLPFLAPSLYDEERWVGMLQGQEWLWPATEPGVGVLVHGLALVVGESRAAQLRLTGNGVVALQAACAVVELGRRIGL